MEYRGASVEKGKLVKPEYGVCSARVSSSRPLTPESALPANLSLFALLAEIHFPLPLLINSSVFLELSSSFLQYLSVQLIKRDPQQGKVLLYHLCRSWAR